MESLNQRSDDRRVGFATRDAAYKAWQQHSDPQGAPAAPPPRDRRRSLFGADSDVRDAEVRTVPFDATSDRQSLSDDLQTGDNEGTDDDDDDSDIALASCSGSSVHGSTAPSGGSSSATSARGAGHRDRRRTAIPFFVWTALAMAVPIVLLVAFSVVSLVPAVSDLIVVRKHRTLLSEIHSCSANLMRERGLLGPWMAAGTATAWSDLSAARRDVDACRSRVFVELRDRSADRKDAFAEAVAADYDTTTHMARIRTLVDARGPGGREAREFFTAAIRRMLVSYTTVAELLQTKAAARLFQLRATFTLRNYVGLARGVGNAIALAPAPPTAETRDEYVQAYAQVRSTQALAFDTASGAVKADLLGWDASPQAVRMWFLFTTMERTNGSAYIQANASTAWWADVSASLQLLTTVDGVLLREVVP